MALRIGIDVGGTYTDLTAAETPGGRVVYHKVRSTPSDPSIAVLSGLDDILAKLSADGEDIKFLGHGTTVVTNMIVERKGAEIAVVTTKGFRDVLELARQARPHLYNYRITRPPPLAGREMRFELAERMAADGTVEVALDLAGLESIAERLKASSVEAIAICLLHSYRNGTHERIAASVLQERLPDAFISISSDVAPEFREYERFSSTALNVFVGPRAASYFSAVEDGLRQRSVRCPFYTVSSNGGLLDSDTVRKFPIRTALSGPSAGVAGAARISSELGINDIVTFDVGGTSTDIAVIVEGKPQRARQRNVAGYPILAPMVDMEVIGAGGGSLAVVDRAGGLRVGPESAGADPGPVACSQGGTQPTLTDALLVLGCINPAGLLGGSVPLDLPSATHAIKTLIAEPLSLETEEAARGIVRIAAANMSRAIRSAAVAKGYDPQRFTLAAYGGAGPLLACDVAEMLGIRQIVIPKSPGTLCAQSILLGELRRDYSRTVSTSLSEDGWEAIRNHFGELVLEAENWLAGGDTAGSRRSFEYIVECRYMGQNFELGVSFQDIPEAVDDVIAMFSAVHTREQGIDFPGRAVEVMTIRIVATGILADFQQDSAAESGDTGPARERSFRRVLFDNDWTQTETRDRQHLGPGEILSGPLIIEEESSTILVKPGYRATVTKQGLLTIVRHDDAE